jgi:hypothetical protein
VTAPAITERLDELRAAARRERLSRFDPQSLLWLAAVPEWPLPLALALGFPTGTAATVPDLVGELASAGLVERRDVLDDDGEVVPVFWLPPSQRPDVGGHLQQVLGREVLDGVRLIRDALEPVGLSRPELLPPHWLEGAGTLLRDPSGAALNDLLDTWVRDERTAAAGEALAAAQAVGDVVGEPMASAARRGRWRLDRAYRQALDERALRDYLPRPELEGVLADLVQGRVGAVHLLGHGGVGKTMVIRHLASGSFAGTHGLQPFPVARVDFDHLDPRYPQTRPAELLLALAAELTGYTSTRGSFQSWRRFDDAAAALHEALAGSGAHTGDTDRQLDAAVDAFAAYLDGLGGPVVLVLDTCEELAKLHAPGAPSPALDRTFDVIERVRARTDVARFLLAGRRWLVPRPGEPAGAADILLRPRDYLKVVPVGGFSGPEAGAYLDHRDPGRRIGPDLRRAIVERCVTGDEINPFDLACYVDWAVSEPGLDPATLRAVPGDPYVEQRILGRLTNADVREAVPVAVLLGRFDRDMIAPTLARRGIDPDVAFSGLAGQEWMASVSFHDDGRPRVIEVDEHLRPRLLTALRAGAQGRDVDTHDVAADLREMVSERPVEDLPVEAVEAALRLLPPRAAGELWAQFELRIARAGAWGWAAQVLPRIAAVEAELADRRDETVLGAILATQAAATLRQPGRPGLGELWSQVGALAPRHPDPEQAERLTYRSTCGLIALGPVRQPLPIRRSGADLWSFVAVVDAFPMPDQFDELTRAADARAAATALLARATVTGTVEDVDAALARLDSADPGEFAEPIVDWVLPPRLRDRARLARTVLALERGERPEDLPLADWRAEALEHLHDIDSHRLAAATIALESAWRLPDPAFVAAAAERETYVPGRRATNAWHRRVDGVRAWVARSAAAFGDLDGAVEMLRARREEAVANGEDPDTIARCDATLVELCRTYRTTEFIDSLPPPAATAPSAMDDARVARALVRGEPLDTDVTPAAGPHPAPRARGEYAMRSAEVLALTRPREACALLEAAAGQFQAAGDARSEHRSWILLVLTAARGGFLDEIRDRLGVPPLPWPDGEPDLLGGWRERERLARAVLAGDPGRVKITSHSPELAFPGVSPLPPRRPATSGSMPHTAPPAMEPTMTAPPPADFPGAPQSRPVPPPPAPEPADWSPPPFATARPVPRRRRLLPAFLTLAPIALAVLAVVVVVLPGESGDPTAGEDPGRELPDPSSFGWGFAAFVAGTAALLVAGWFGRHRLARLRGRRHDTYGRLNTSHATPEPAEPPGAGPRFRGPYHLAPNPAHDLPAYAPISVLHLVGEPVPTAAGWRLRVQGAVSEAAQYSQSRGKYAGEELLDPGDAAAGRPTLVVLQADTGDGPPQPLDYLREGMLELAGAIKNAGPTVLVVPPVPDPLAREIIQRCADFGRRPSTITPGAIADLTREIGVLVGGDAGHDVMLFV